MSKFPKNQIVYETIDKNDINLLLNEKIVIDVYYNFYKNDYNNIKVCDQIVPKKFVKEYNSKLFYYYSFLKLII